MVFGLLFSAGPSSKFLETIIVSRYCQKFLSSKNYLYWRKKAFVKVAVASRAPVAFAFYSDSDNFFMPISR